MIGYQHDVPMTCQLLCAVLVLEAGSELSMTNNDRRQLPLPFRELVRKVRARNRRDSDLLEELGVASPRHEWWQMHISSRLLKLLHEFFSDSLRFEKSWNVCEVKVRLECLLTVLKRLLFKTSINRIKDPYRTTQGTFHKK